MKRFWTIVVVGLVLAPSCGGQTTGSGTGSETNWVGGCTTGADCAGRECLCGVCASPCSVDDPCLETGFCAENGSPIFRSVCGEAPDVSGLCLARCGADAPCGNGMECTDGACVPVAEPRRIGAPVGAAVVLSDMQRANFPGFSSDEININERLDACASTIAVVENFTGRPGCPYGQSDPAQPECFTPNGEPVTVPVPPQLLSRPPEDAIYCSCRCDGPDDGPYCACPSGFECRKLVDDLGQGNRQLAGSYCTKAGTYVADDPSALGDAVCDAALKNCEGR